MSASPRMPVLAHPVSQILPHHAEVRILPSPAPSWLRGPRGAPTRVGASRSGSWPRPPPGQKGHQPSGRPSWLQPLAPRPLRLDPRHQSPAADAVRLRGCPNQPWKAGEPALATAASRRRSYPAPLSRRGQFPQHFSSKSSSCRQALQACHAERLPKSRTQGPGAYPKGKRPMNAFKTIICGALLAAPAISGPASAKDAPGAATWQWSQSGRWEF